MNRPSGEELVGCQFDWISAQIGRNEQKRAAAADRRVQAISEEIQVVEEYMSLNTL